MSTAAARALAAVVDAEHAGTYERPTDRPNDRARGDQSNQSVSASNRITHSPDRGNLVGFSLLAPSLARDVSFR